MSKKSEKFEVDFDINEISKNGLYRIGTGAVICKDGLVFCAKRLDNIGGVGEESLQMPQGGVDEGEAVHDAIFREVFEETGIKNDKLKLVARTADFVYYDIPEHLSHILHGRRGQAQIWYQFEFLGDDSDIDLNATEHKEFSEYFFKKPEEIIEGAIFFKKDLYIEIFSSFGLIK